MKATSFRRRLAAEQGFTLVELMIVVVILGILTLIAFPSYISIKGRATDNANKANLRNAVTAIDAFFQDNQGYSGMTLNSLLSYNAALDLSKYTLAGVTSTTYCVQSPTGTAAHTWRKSGPAGAFELNHC
jgi:prepilin-type N-terminal cleavage/methylation domain-containing protein